MGRTDDASTDKLDQPTFQILTFAMSDAIVQQAVGRILIRVMWQVGFDENTQ
jgi:hypothetical protein